MATGASTNFCPGTGGKFTRAFVRLDVDRWWLARGRVMGVQLKRAGEFSGIE
jgi:hypothetical protein